MNETMKTILNRRSTRVFKEDSIDESLVNEIIEAGLYAPSGHNMQPWHFTVITNKDLLNLLSYETKEACKNFDDEFIKKVANNEKFNVFYNAPVGVIVSGDKNAMTVESDVAAASENMLLAAESLGIGGCWIGFITLLFRSEKAQEFKKKLSIPEEFTPMHGLVFGHKKTEMSKAPERKTGRVSFLK